MWVFLGFLGLGVAVFSVRVVAVLPGWAGGRVFRVFGARVGFFGVCQVGLGLGF
jgi:hypothetical protein